LKLKLTFVALALVGIEDPFDQKYHVKNSTRQVSTSGSVTGDNLTLLSASPSVGIT
jgi:hypothetical protein